MRIWQESFDGSLTRVLCAPNSSFGLYVIGGKRRQIWVENERIPVIRGFVLVFHFGGQAYEFRNMLVLKSEAGYILKNKCGDIVYNAIPHDRNRLEVYFDIHDEITRTFEGSPQLFRKARAGQ